MLIGNPGISEQQTAASFVRPTRRIDQPQGFLEALRQKYASEFEEELAKRKAAGHDDVQMNELIRFNGKVVEEVGFEKIRKQLAELQDLKIVLLDNQCVAGVCDRDDVDDYEQLYREELEKIQQTCPKIAELDLSRNLLCRWKDVRDICEQLKQLKSLKLKYVICFFFFFFIVNELILIHEVAIDLKRSSLVWYLRGYQNFTLIKLL